MSAIRLVALVVSLLSAACASNPSPSSPAPESGGAAVRVDNHSSLDMDVYVHAHESVVRLGFAPSNQVTRLPLAPGLIAGAGLVQFEARPTRGGERVLSDAFTVQPGDDLSWVIPAQ